MRANLKSSDTNSSFSIIVHGGAWDIPVSLHDAHLGGVEKAVREGYRCLMRGVISIDSQGRTGFSYNTPYMARALADKNGISHVGIKSKKSDF